MEFRNQLGRAPKGLKWIVLAAALVYPLYLVVANVMLKTRLVRGLATGGPTTLDYAAASSWWFGAVAVDDLRLRIDGDAAQILLVIPHAEVRISLLDVIFRRTFHATKVRTEGTQFSLRHRVDHVDDDNRQRVAAFPPIPGLDPIPLAVAGPPRPPTGPLSAAERKSWTIFLEDVEARLDQVWIEEYRYRGVGVARGAFRLALGKTFWLGPTTLDLDGGTMEAAPFVVARDIVSRNQAVIDTVDLTHVTGASILEYLEAHTSISSTMPAPEFLGLYLDQPKFSGGAGHLSLDARFDRGAFAAGTLAHADMIDLVLTARGLASKGTTAVTFNATDRGVYDIGVDSASTAIGLAGDASGGGRAKPDSVGRVENASARFTLASSDISKTHRLVKADLKAKAILTAMGDFFAALGTHAIKGGSASVDASLAFADNAWSGVWDGQVKNGQFALGPKIRVTTDATMKGRASAPRELDPVDLSDIHVQGSRVVVEGPGRSSATSMSVHTPHLTIAGDPKCVAFSSDLSASSAGFVASMFDAGPLEPVAVELLKGRPLRAHARMLTTAHAFRLDIDESTDGSLEGRGILVKPNGVHPMVGAFLVRGGILDLGVDLHPDGTSLKPFSSMAWYEEHRGELTRLSPACAASATPSVREPTTSRDQGIAAKRAP